MVENCLCCKSHKCPSSGRSFFVFTWKALARALAPSFSRRFLPAMNTLSLSGDPRDEDCLWPSIRASARICLHQINYRSHIKNPFHFWGLFHHFERNNDAWELTFPPPIPIPQLLSLSSLSVWQEGLFNSCSIPLTPSGPKALSLKSSSVSLAPALINALPRDLYG